jgi:hypothetical protein
MVNRSKAKGTAAETRVVNALLAAGAEARRKVLKGSADEGDIQFKGIWAEGVLEVKAGKQTLRVGRKQKQDWLDEARIEGLNSGCRAWLVIAKHGSSVRDYEVWFSDGRTFFYFDEFLEWIKDGRL